MITTKQFQQLSDINLVWDFMVEVYDNRFGGGVAAPFFEYALTSSWMDKNYLYLSRIWLDGDKVVAFVFYENPVTNIFFNLRPGYEELAGELVTYAEQCMPNFGEQELVLFAGQEAIRNEVEKRGYKIAWENVDYIFDFTKGDLNYPLPEGFHFVDPLKSDPFKLAVCMWKGFDHEDKGPFVNWNTKIEGEAWTPQRAYNGIISSAIAPPPHATHQYNIIIADEKEEYVCFSGMCFLPENKLAYMEPLCTVPEYRGRGLAAAALSEHCRRLKLLGAEMMTGGGGEFYKKIGYEDGIHWLHYQCNRCYEKELSEELIAKEDTDKETVRPEILRFLDAEDAPAKLKVLRELRMDMDESLLTTIEISLDLLPDDKESLERRYDFVERTLEQKIRFEGGRLR